MKKQSTIALTPHINAKKGDFAKTVLMPGDPLRAKFIAETFLKNPKLLNSVRNMLMYTGTYKGHKISICASGMGMPSIGIYSYELFKFFDVDRIIRIGTTGSYRKELKIYDVVLAKECYADSNTFAKEMLGKTTNVMKPSANLNKRIEKVAKDLNLPIHKSRIHCSDVFYGRSTLAQKIKISKADCVEMESFALFANAIATGKEAACLLTVSDNLATHEITTPEERQEAFLNMIKIALELA